MIAHKTEGKKGVIFTVRYMERFNEMQNMIQEQQPRLPGTYKEALQQLLEQVEENEKLAIENKEKDKFIKQIEGSQNTLLVREVAKIISTQHGIVIGEKQLYKKLREWNWVFEKSTEAKQEAIRRGYLELREGTRETLKGIFTFHTTRVTGKGQKKILEKLLEESQGL